ncbi:MAG: LysR family transcriptional regulator [Deferribacteres bacterium]|nr:LysR family transcriptional regulator [candidate division KSB1 bacterium]MCB9502473.1 LysR family transcriptional regulator [Deferribacteres bacterium]
MTLTQLEYIIAVYDSGSFSKAAEQCFITQPTLSMQIQKLEDELGIIIFDRSKKPVKATPIGEKVIEQARYNVQGLRRIKEVVQEHTEEVAGHLRVGIIPTLAPYLLPLFVPIFLQKYPKVSLSIVELVSEQIMSGLKQNKLDIGLLVTPLNDSALTETPLFYESFLAYISTNHPLIHNETIELATLNIEEMLLLSEGHCFREQVVNICPDNKDVKSGTHLHFESGSLETLKRIVEKNFGYTLLPQLAVLQISEENKRFIKELQEPKPMREVSLVVHHTNLSRSLVQAFKESIVENLPPHIKANKKKNVIKWL